MKTALTVLLMSLSCATVFAQIRVNGTVQDSDGNPIAGAAVLVTGTSNGTIADVDGHFELANVAGKASIEVSFLGYATKTVAVDNRSQIVIVLEEDVDRLDEIIVVGYSVTTKRDLITSVSTVKTEQISNLPVTNLAQGLAGRSPGLIVQASGGGINATPSISIRGGGSPLYVIDGVIRSAVDFQNLSPDDIESFSILKDASATAIYGSRAMNGIVQVQTKRGKAGTTNVEYDFNQSWAQPNIWPDKLDSYTRAEYANIARANDGLDPAFSEEDIQYMRDGSHPLTHNNVNWRKLVLNEWAPQQKHTARVTGGNDVNRYYISLGQIDQNSLYKTGTNWMKRTNFRMSESVTIKTIGLQVNATLDGYVQTTNHPYTSTSSSYYNVFSHINDRTPLTPGVNNFGLPYNSTDNPVAETAADAGYIRGNTNVVSGQGELIWSVPWVEGLRLRASSNYRYYSETTKSWRKDAAQYNWDSTEPIYAGSPTLQRYAGNGYSFTNQAFVNYDNTFGKHHVSGLFGFEQYYQNAETLYAYRQNYDFAIPQLGVGDSNTQTNSGTDNIELGRAAWIGQAKYNYAGKYYLEGSVRRDGSDYFAPGKRWGTFFSGSFGWVVTEEKFMQELVSRDIFNSLKLRASYGETGQDSSAGRFAYMTTYGFSSTGYVVDGEFVPTFSEGAIPSPDLTWYTSRQTDFGLDFSSLKSRLYGSLDYFYYSTKGFLVAPTGESYLQQVIGTNMPYVKSNSELRRAGFEFQLGWRDTIGDFRYDVSANFTYFDQLWARDESESEASYMNPYQRTQQQRGYAGLYYHNLGYYKNAQEVFESPGFTETYGTDYITAGDIRYEDTNGDGRITSADARRLGKSSMPRGQYGININLGYKGFYLSALFQGSTSFHRYISAEQAGRTGQQGNFPIAYEYQTDYWTPDNTDAMYPRLMSNTGYNGNNNYMASDFWLINGAYVRMKDLQFGYDFKQELLKNVKWVSKLRIGLSGQNIFTFSKLKKYGIDPEASSVDYYGYPLERVLALNVNLGF